MSTVFTRQLPASNKIVVTGGHVGIDGSVFKLDVFEAYIDMDGGLMDDTGSGDGRRYYLAYGNAWVIGRLRFRGWLTGGDTDALGLANVGTGTELDMTLTLMNTWTVAGKFVNGTMALGAAKRSKRPAMLTGMYSGVTEANT